MDLPRDPVDPVEPRDPARAPFDGAACAQHPNVAASAPCARCGSFACPACLSPTPEGQWACPPCHERLPTGEVPWERRTELGFWTAWWRTTIGGMVSPGRTFNAMPKNPELGSAAGFVALQSFIAALPTCLMYVAIFAVMAVSQTSGGVDGDAGATPRAGGAEMLGPILVFVFWALLAPVFGVASTFIWGSFDHLLLRLFGGRGSWATTVRANAYSQAAMAVGVIPLCSIYVWPIWTIVTRFFAYRAAHQVSTPVALVGALGTPLLCCGGWGALVLVSVAALRP